MARMHSDLPQNIILIILNKPNQSAAHHGNCLKSLTPPQKKDPTEKLILVFINKNFIILSTSVKPNYHH